jgi:hypothetical protein
MKRETLEHQLFTWEDWEEDGPMDLQFTKVTLVAQMGDFPIGTKFKAGVFYGSQSLLILMDEKEEEHYFDLRVSVGAKLPAEMFQHEERCQDEGCVCDREED